MLTISKDDLTNAIASELNILVHGGPGTGKYSNLKALLSELDLTVAEHDFSNALPTDLLLNPPLDADVLILDDLQNADADDLAVVTSLLDSDTIAGKELPNLKLIIGVYTTLGDEVVPANLEARFHISATVA